MNKTEVLQKAEKLIEQAEKLIPKTLEPDLPATKLIPNVPEWYGFEYKIWKLGDDLRLLIKANPTLQKEDEIFQRILKVCTNRNAKRGRQSFIMLLGAKRFSIFATDLITQIDDENVDGHVISTIQKMHAAGFENQVKPFIEHEHAWIRNAAKKYLAQNE